MSQTTGHIFGESGENLILREVRILASDMWGKYNLPETKLSKPVLDDHVLGKAKKVLYF